MIEENWIETNLCEINTKIKKKNKMNSKYEKQLDNQGLMKLLFLVLLSATLLWSSLNADHITCPKCFHEIEATLTVDHNVGIFGETWTCPNQYCQYENYVGIDTCCICGTKRP